MITMLKKVSAFLLAVIMLLLCIPIGMAEETAPEVQDLNVTNTPVQGRISLSKHGLQLKGFETVDDGMGNVVHRPIYKDDYLTGAVFEVRADEDIVGHEGTAWFNQDDVAAVITTTGAANDATGLLPLGRYYVVETSAPYGYVLDDTQYAIHLEAIDDHTPVVQIGIAAENTFLPAEVSLTKEVQVLECLTDEDGQIRQRLSEVPGEGFVFGLYNFSGIEYPDGELPADTLIATGKTDAKGHLTFSGYYPHGEYYIKELSGPAGWSLMKSVILFDILPGDTSYEDELIKVVLDEPILNELIYTPVTLTKTNLGSRLSLPGCWLELSNEDGDVVYSGYTDDHGCITNIMLVPGKYTFREIKAPNGYELSEEVLAFYVSEDGSIWGDTTIADDVTRFCVQKVDEKHEPLAGAEFGLKDAEGKIIMTAVSDDQGYATFDMVPCGEYTIVELTAPSGYLAADVSVPVTVTPTFINPSEPLAVIDNCPNEVLLKKVDQNDAALPGAQFGLFDADGKRVRTATSDEEGMVRFTHVPVGSYTIREVSAPEGYLLSHDVIELKMDADWQNTSEPIAIVKDQLKRIMFLKVDTSGNPVPGVTFNLINAATGEIAETVSSNVDGVFIFTKFGYGDWIVHEATVPDGFIRMEDITFHVGDDWTAPDPVMCVNIPDHYEFLKTDSSGKPMAGVKFSMEDESGENVITLVSGEDGIVRVDDLLPGTYFIKEVETWKGYTLSGEIIKVVVDQHYVIPEQMRKMVNYTVIQTGVNLAVTGIMWVGIALMLGSGVVAIIRKRKHGAA